MIRACVDANFLISYLLNPAAARPPNRIVEAGIAQKFNLVLIETTLLEITESIRTKPYLTARIDPQMVAKLESALRFTATVIPESISDIPRLTRDPGDDYLIAHAILQEFDYLITGDQDLLVLGTFEGVRIVSPAEFAMILDER